MIRLLTAGESHGPQITAILEGVPAGIPVPPATIDKQLARRQKGYGSGGRMRIERDRVQVTGGVMAGQSTGAPISLVVTNRDFANWQDRAIEPLTVPRPGHADLTAAVKYGYRELRLGLERASARETTMRVAAGAICRAYLAEFGIRIVGYVRQLGAVQADLPALQDEAAYEARFAAAEASDVRCPDAAAAAAMRKAIRQVKIDRDTLGGVFEVVALGVPPGLGSHVHYDRRLDGRIVAALVSIHAMKGAEIGPAFENAGRRGSKAHDAILRDEAGNLTRRSNRAGGIEGGITTGQPIVARVAMKPISTLLQGIDSVDLATGEASPTVYERSDFCALPRAVPVGEAMLAFVLAQELAAKLGGDSLAEQKPRFAALRQAHLDDLPMAARRWRFDEEGGL
ncbi:MAG: chorismate synthase [Anaerolineaceae bacterium]|nr:chorismate synthase [Anaerolineaceae bacterium]